jgi:hypothetical protein
MGFWKKLNDFITMPTQDKDNYKNSKIANKKFIEHYFKLNVMKQKGESKNEFNVRLENIGKELMSVVLGGLLPYPNISSKKSMTFKAIHDAGEQWYFLVRFPDIRKDMQESIITEKKKGDKRSYKFSPVLSLEAISALKQIEFQIHVVFGLESREETTEMVFEKGVPHIIQSDGIQEYSYPIKERLLLYKEHPELESNVFNQSAPKYLEWLMNRRNHNAHMKKYCNAVDKILKEIKLGESIDE